MKPMVPVTAVAAPTASAVPSNTWTTQAREIHAKARRLLLTQRQRIQCAARQQQDADARDHERRSEQQLVPAAIGERTHHPVRDLVSRIGIRREVQHQRRAASSNPETAAPARISASMPPVPASA